MDHYFEKHPKQIVDDTIPQQFAQVKGMTKLKRGLTLTSFICLCPGSGVVWGSFQGSRDFDFFCGVTMFVRGAI